MDATLCLDARHCVERRASPLDPPSKDTSGTPYLILREVGGWTREADRDASGRAQTKEHSSSPPTLKRRTLRPLRRRQAVDEGIFEASSYSSSKLRPWAWAWASSSLRRRAE